MDINNWIHIIVITKVAKPITIVKLQSTSMIEFKQIFNR